MPLVRITLAEGRTAEELRAIADGVHEALVEAAGVPRDDRFQAVHEVPAGRLFWDETYLGQKRSRAVVFIQITLNLGRTTEVKKALYAAIARRLVERPGMRADDVLISLVEVPKENWSFGGGMMSYP